MKAGQAQYVKNLLAIGADPETLATTGSKTTMIGCAAYYNTTTEIALALLEKEVNVNHINKDNRTPLDLAILGKRNNLIELLCVHGALKYKDISDPISRSAKFYESVKTGHVSWVKSLLKIGANPDSLATTGSNTTMLGCAAYYNDNTEITRELLKCGHK